MAFEGIKAQAPLILNILRAINVIGLLSAAIASMIVVIKTSQLTVGWWFFDTLSYVFAAGSCVFLILSEVPVLASIRTYYEYNWPLLSHHHGLSWLALMMIMISAHVLGSLYNPARHLEGSFRAMVLAGGVMVFASAIITFLASFFFRDRKNNLNARTLRSKKAAAASAASSAAGSMADGSSFRGDWGIQEKEKPSGFIGKLFGGKKTTTGGVGGDRPNISRPFADEEANAGFPPAGFPPAYNRRSPSIASVSEYRQSPPPPPPVVPAPPADVARFDDRRSPINPDVKRPETKDHPFWQSRFREEELKHDMRYSAASIPRDFI